MYKRACCSLKVGEHALQALREMNVQILPWCQAAACKALCAISMVFTNKAIHAML